MRPSRSVPNWDCLIRRMATDIREGRQHAGMSLSCPWPQGECIANISGMSKSLACRVGRHSWETEMRRLDDVEAARPVLVCSHCGKTATEERIPASHGTGYHDPPNMGGGGADLGGGGGW